MARARRVRFLCSGSGLLSSRQRPLDESGRRTQPTPLPPARSGTTFLSARIDGQHLFEDSEKSAVQGAEFAARADLRCDIFGNFLPPQLTFDPSWLTSTVTTLAQTMYDTRDFSAMSILADACLSRRRVRQRGRARPLS